MQPLVLRKHAKNFFNLFLEVLCRKFSSVLSPSFLQHEGEEQYYLGFNFLESQLESINKCIIVLKAFDTSI